MSQESSRNQSLNPLLSNFIWKKANPVQIINNADLDAGDPMYFYCRACRHIAAIFAEGYIEIPPNHCDECLELIRKYKLIDLIGNIL